MPANTESQIRALLTEKASRNAAQVKMDSHLVHAAQILRGQAVSPDFPEPPGELESVHRDEHDVVEVDLRGDITPNLLEAIRGAGGTVENSSARLHALRARLPLLNVERIAARDDVRQVRLAARARLNGAAGNALGGHVAPGARGAAVRAQLSEFFAAHRGGYLPAPLLGSVLRSLGVAFAPSTEGPDTYGDAAHQGPAARSTFTLDGTGIKVGVISDGVNSLAGEQAAGHLPSAVTVIPLQAGSGDEGTAMLEVVYTLAPGAQLYFATGNGGESQMATNIEALQAQGCNIIVDDLTYFPEGPFQDDIVAQAVNTVTGQGVFYFSAAGNNGNLLSGTSGTWVGNFVDSGTTFTSGAASGAVHSFGATNYNVLTSPSSVGVLGAGGIETGAYELMWSDPLNLSNNDYDLFITDASGNVQGSSTNVQNGTEDPEEDITGSPTVQNACESGTCRILVVKHSSAAVRALFVSTERGTLSIATAGATYGHAAAANAFTVAATNARYGTNLYIQSNGQPLAPNCTGFSMTCNNGVESWSADGPRQMFYNADGSAITPGNVLTGGGLVLSKPDMTAADAVNTGVNGYTVFAGTSAAAPHAAAMTALMLEGNPALTPAAMHAALAAGTANGIDIADLPATDVGVGVMMAPGAVQNACGYSIGTAPKISGAGGSATLTIFAGANCPWSITGLPSWVSGATSGKGNGTVTLTVTANSTGASRNASIGLSTSTADGALSVAAATVTQAAGNSAPITITAPGANGVLLSGFVGGAYQQDLAATGGSGAYTWSVSSGALPSWASLGGASITGTPSAAAVGTVTFTIKVTDAAGDTATLPCSLTVVGASGASAPARIGVFSQFAAGGTATAGQGWDMTMFLVNSSPVAAIPVKLIIYDDDGTTKLKNDGGTTPTPTAFTVTQQGDVQSDFTKTEIEIDRVLNPNTTLTVSCGLGQSVLVQGWVDVQAGPNDANGLGVNGYAIFRRGYVTGLTTGAAGFDSSGPAAANLIPPIEGTVPLQTQLTATEIVMPFDSTNGNNYFNAVAIGTLASTAGTIVATYYDQNGNMLGTPQTVPLPSGCVGLCHTAFGLSYAAAANTTGTVVFTGGTGLIGLGLRGSPYGTLTDVPIIAH